MDNKTFIPIISYKDFRVIESIPDELTFHENHIRIRGRNKIEKPSEETGVLKEWSYDYDFFIDKAFVSGAIGGYSNKREVYETTIEVSGENSTTFCFEKKSDALKLYNKILNWKYNK